MAGINQSTKVGKEQERELKRQAKIRNWQDPDFVKKMDDTRAAGLAKRHLDKDKNWRYGIPNGYTRATAEQAWATSRLYAEKVIKIMVKKEMLDEGSAATKALKEAIAVMDAPGNQQVKLAAARLVLDFTKAKPASKTELTVSAAENWLAEVTQDYIDNEDIKDPVILTSEPISD
jgi:hypothetical protein